MADKRESVSFIPLDSNANVPRSNYRSIVLIWCGLGTAIMMYLRLNLNVAIVTMVHRGHSNASLFNMSAIGNETYTNEFNSSVETNGTVEDDSAISKFMWSESLQGLILGAYYFGFTPTQILAARLVEMYDAVKLAGYGMIVSAILTMLTPVAANLGVTWLVVVRALIGLFQGPFSICTFVMISRWLPKTERSKGMAAIVLGMNIGPGIFIPLTTFLCEYGPWGGWPSALVMSGIVTLLWTLGWFCFVSNFPKDNPRVTKLELQLIQHNKEHDNTKNQKASAPWKAIFTSKGVWASIVAKGAAIFSIHIIHSKLPTYLETVLNLDLQTNGLINAAINFSSLFSTLLAGYFADLMFRKKVTSLTNVRKIFQTAAMLGPAICFMLITVSSGHDTIIIMLLVFAMFCMGFMSGGDLPITTDMAPHFTGTLFGITNTFASSMGFMAPAVAGIILDSNSQLSSQWSVVFYFCSALLLFGIIFFDIFATAEVQPWGLVDNNRNEEEKMELNLAINHENQGKT
ncbi:putative inorganic phosphate cotransporter [Halotydeus destructor]|nr:putative inorganic phosphate cotransporter [Halotydeus destructor]